MKRKTITYAILALFLLTTLAFKYAQQAEDSKQIMTIVQLNGKVVISTPTDVKEMEVEDKGRLGVTALSIISDYEKKGWVVKNTNMVAWNLSLSEYYFYLEK